MKIIRKCCVFYVPMLSKSGICTSYNASRKPWSDLFKTLGSIRARSSNFEWHEPTNGFKTDLKIYNSISRLVTPLTLMNENIVKWYTCGPTVYDEAHMGHVSCYVRLDIIRRIMENYLDLYVFMVMGMTDIDDKIIKRANETNLKISQVTKKYEAEFHYDMKSFNVKLPSLVTRVTDHIPQIIRFISKIIEKKLAYVTPSGTVYFDTKAFGSYGRFFSQPDIENQEGIDPNKKNPVDFALWKAMKESEPFWESPWGKGRPGWHIECSAMASHVFGAKLDIHSGGIDLLFPHHENEECQSVAFHQIDQWANFWIHTGHLHLKNDAKMSKSLKNTVSTKEFLENNSSDDFRMLCLMIPYGNNIELSEESLHAPKMFLKKVVNFLDDCEAYCNGQLVGGQFDEAQYLNRLNIARTKIKDDFNDNFNTPKAMESIFELITDVQKVLQSRSDTISARNVPLVSLYSSFVKQLFKNLGFNLNEENKSQKIDDNVTSYVDLIVKFRDTVRENALNSMASCKKGEKNIETETVKTQSILLLKYCDKVRDELLESGIQIKDRGKGDSTWTVNKDFIKKPSK